MMAGALILLANALAEALMEPDQPRWIKIAATMIGFVLLAVGFGQRMRERR